MAQIAQQDNLIIEITGALAAMDGTTKQKLIDCIKVGPVNPSKVLGYMVDTTAAIRAQILEEPKAEGKLKEPEEEEKDNNAAKT